MENFVLYEELGKGRNSFVYKGRRKGHLNFVAIVCTHKNKKLEISNHVRLSYHLDHPNIVRYYEWYETCSHLWLVVELCTGGSLQALVAQDGGLSEDVVKRFGWDLVMGLKHIHESEIILSDLTPAKILLDGSGILKLGNFCLSKAKGETLEETISFLSDSEETGEDKSLGDFNSMRKRFQGNLAYKAPEIVQGSETSVSSDLWALGCVLYYMYTGNPPFFSESNTELAEMLLNQELPPPRKTCPPSPDFQSLLNGLLTKNPEKRFGWTELLDHAFWKQLKQENNKEEVSFKMGHAPSSCSSFSESKPPISSNTNALTRTPCNTDTHEQQSMEQMFSGQLRNDQALQKTITVKDSPDEWDIDAGDDDPEPTGVEQMCQTLQLNKSYKSDNSKELRPKSGVDDDSTETIFLHSYSATTRGNPSTSDSPNNIGSAEICSKADMADRVRSLLYNESDLTVTPIIDNPKIVKSASVRFDPKTLCVPAYSVEKLISLSEEEWSGFLLQLCSSLEEQRPSTTQPSSQSTAIRSKLNLLCYLCCVAGHTTIANKLINSTLLLVLTKELRKAPNWDLRSKVLRLMGLLALHCSHLEESSHICEAVSMLADLLRENLKNSKLKQFLIPPLGEFLYLICSQEEKRGSPEGLCFVPAAAYTGLMRSLREGVAQAKMEMVEGSFQTVSCCGWKPVQDDAVNHHMIAKVIENISTVVSGPSHPLVTTEMGAALWYLFTHSTVEAVRVTAISSLSRLTRVNPAVFLSVLDTCGPAAVMEGMGGTGARVQQHLLTAVATVLLTSTTQTRRISQNQDLVLKVLRCLESPSTVTRGKALLLLLLLTQDNKQTLLYCCQNRLVLYLERDLRKAIPVRNNPSQSGYLCQCLDLLIIHLSAAAQAIMDDNLNLLRGVVGRRHPSKAQSKQLKQTLPTMCVVLDLLSSQIFRAKIVTKDFLIQMGFMLNFITTVDSNELDLTLFMGATIAEELIRTTLSIVEVLSQHYALISTYHSIVVQDLLPPLTSLAFSKNAEWSVFVLKVLSELSLVLLVQDDDHTKEKEERTRQKKEMEKTGENAAEGREDGKLSGQILSLLSKSLLLRYDILLAATEPIPLYALKLLVSLTEHNAQICRLISQGRILPMVFHLIMANSVTSGIVQTGIVLLCNLSGNTVFDQQLQYHEGLIKVVVSTFSEITSLFLDGERRAGRKVNHLLLQAFFELLHNILKQTSAVVRAALQSQRLSHPAAETEAAEKLLVANRPLSQLSTLLIQMLPTENQEVWEESVQCLSLLVQLYAGEGHNCLSPSGLQSLSQMLRVHMQAETPRMQRTALKIIKRLIQTADRSAWSDSPEGAELIAVLQDMTSSNRCHADVAPLVAEMLQDILGP
ncbi:serine/threonine-protein kinase ULK4 isoform X2 [Oryzias latipes]|uniref:serine/threonine-protein kinase ULK4 isoform X2 n=1 Tax=Oryzias latipes TaxID=8090 RepID=UPI000CE20AFE|nr:serine/threonine-protein kinase ULK4 isoform X2 [Oryzias latipes]